MRRFNSANAAVHCTNTNVVVLPGAPALTPRPTLNVERYRSSTKAQPDQKTFGANIPFACKMNKAPKTATNWRYRDPHCKRNVLGRWTMKYMTPISWEDIYLSPPIASKSSLDISPAVKNKEAVSSETLAFCFSCLSSLRKTKNLRPRNIMGIPRGLKDIRGHRGSQWNHRNPRAPGSWRETAGTPRAQTVQTEKFHNSFQASRPFKCSRFKRKEKNLQDS